MALSPARRIKQRIQSRPVLSSGSVHFSLIMIDRREADIPYVPHLNGAMCEVFFLCQNRALILRNGRRSKDTLMMVYEEPSSVKRRRNDMEVHGRHDTPSVKAGVVRVCGLAADGGREARLMRRRTTQPSDTLLREAACRRQRYVWHYSTCTRGPIYDHTIGC